MAKKLKTKTADIRKLSDADLHKELEETRLRLFKLRLSWETRQLADHNQIPKMKRQVSRLMTITHERELAKAGRSAG